MNLCGELEDFLEEEPDGEVHEKLLEFYFEVSKFLNIYDLVDDHYVIYTYYAPDGSFFSASLLCGYIGKHPEMSGQSERSCLFSRQRFFRCSITSVC